MFVFRMHSLRFEAFDTTGSLLHPGRWHSAGTRVVYAAEHASLAVLENLIHAGGRKLPPRAMTRVFIPDDVSIEAAAWMELPGSRDFGDRWAREMRTAVLRVPSIAVEKMESNFILNPRHPDFSKIGHDPSREFVFHLGFFLPAAG